MTALSTMSPDVSDLKIRVCDLLDSWFDAYATQDVARCVDAYTDEAIIVHPYGPPARGRAAIERLHREWCDAEAGVKKTYELVECDGSGDWAYCVNTYCGRRPMSDGGEEIHTGIVANVLRRQADGSFRVHVSSMHGTDPVNEGEGS